MAYCSECGGKNSALALACDHCDHDFSEEALGETSNKEGFAYSGFADFLLILAGIGVVVGFLFAVLIIIAGPPYGTEGRHMISRVLAPAVACVFLGLLVVFLRNLNR